MYRVTNLTRNTPALCAGNLGGNIHQTSFSTIDITIVAIVHLITDLTWDVAALLSLNLVAHLPTHCIVIIGTTCDQNFLLFGDFFFIVIRMMEMMMIRKAMIVIIMMMMILTMVTCLGTFSQTSLGTWLHTLRGTSLQT